MSNLLALDNIYFSQDGVKLVNGIGFTLSRGNIAGLIGINGAGKSTTLKIAAGILTPDSGTVCTAAKGIGYVPENPPLIAAWTVRAFLHHACQLHGLTRDQQSQALARVSRQCDIADILDKPCKNLSKGNQQRVAIAQALLHKPELLILDEPTSGLDPQQIRQFRKLLFELKPNTAIILSSHIMQEITALCDSAIMIHQGCQVGELDLSEHNQHFSIAFANPVSPAVFAGFPPWQSGTGKQHQFKRLPNYDTNRILAFCLDKALPVIRVLGKEDFAESAFLSTIGHYNAHV